LGSWKNFVAVTARQKEIIMRDRFSGSMVTVAIAAAAVSAAISVSVTLTSAQAPAASGAALKTPWGEPDLQGIWTDEFDIVMDASPHLPASIRQWYGDSRGRWEGNTLIIDVTNFSPKTDYRGSRENLHLVERWTRTGPTSLEYIVTIEAPRSNATKIRSPDDDAYLSGAHGLAPSVVNSAFPSVGQRDRRGSTQATGRAFAGHPAMPRPLWSSWQAAERRRWLPASVPEKRRWQPPPVGIDALKKSVTFWTDDEKRSRLRQTIEPCKIEEPTISVHR
jgi:hypothetical protein